MKKIAKHKNLLVSVERIRDLQPLALRRATGGMCPVTNATADSDTGSGCGDTVDPTSVDCHHPPSKCITSKMN